MSWREIKMKFPGKCAECGLDIPVGAPVMWLKGEGVKHPECASGKASIPCAVCGRPAGCAECELREDCDLERVSRLCIGAACAEDGALEAYRGAVLKKFAVLDPSRRAGQATLA